MPSDWWASRRMGKIGPILSILEGIIQQVNCKLLGS